MSSILEIEPSTVSISMKSNKLTQRNRLQKKPKTPIRPHSEIISIDSRQKKIEDSPQAFRPSKKRSKPRRSMSITRHTKAEPNRRSNSSFSKINPGKRSKSVNNSEKIASSLESKSTEINSFYSFENNSMSSATTYSFDSLYDEQFIFTSKDILKFSDAFDQSFGYHIIGIGQEYDEDIPFLCSNNAMHILMPPVKYTKPQGPLQSELKSMTSDWLDYFSTTKDYLSLYTVLQEGAHISTMPFTDISTEVSIVVTKRLRLNSIDKDDFLNWHVSPMQIDSNWNSLHLFSWHVQEVDPTEIAKIIISILQKLSDAKALRHSCYRLLAYIYSWIIFFSADFSNSSASDSVKKVLKMIGQKEQTLIDRSNIAIEIINGLEANQLKILTPPPPVIYLTTFKPVMSLLTIDIDGLTLVQHFMFVELKQLRRVTRADLFDNGSSVSQLIDRFDKTVLMIATTIMRDTAEFRAKRIEYWIDVLRMCFDLHEFQLAFEIVSALTSPPIRRLSKSWSNVSETSKKVFGKFLRIMSPDKGFRMYMIELLKVPVEQTMPFILPMISSLMAMNEKHSDYVEIGGKNEINLNKLRMCVRLCNVICGEWGKNCRFQLDRGLKNLIKKLDGGAKSTEELMLFSRLLEE